MNYYSTVIPTHVIFVLFFCVKRIVEEISLNAKKHTNQLEAHVNPNLSKIFHNYTDESESVVIKIKLKKNLGNGYFYIRLFFIK